MGSLRSAMEGAPCGWLLVSLALTLVLTPAMEDHGSAVTSLDDGKSVDVQPLATGGYHEIKGFVHKDKDTMQVMYTDVAECRSHCDADTKCQSFSYDAKKHDCLVSSSALRFDPQWSYYSRMPWLHQKNIDEPNNDQFGATLGRYSVFTGMLYPARAKWRERRYISLDHCKTLCDADPPGKVESNERLAHTDPHAKYDEGDGCVAFSYNRNSQTCLLNGTPMAYNPEYTYFAKNSVEADATGFSKDSASAAKVSEQVHRDLSTQAANAKKSEAAAQQSANAEEAANINSQAKAVEEKQNKIEAEAERAAEEQMNDKLQAAAVKAKKLNNGKAKDSKEEQEKTVKEKTDKDLRKEAIAEEQRHRDSERESKEHFAKKKAQMDIQAAARMVAKNKEAAAKALERRQKTNLAPMLNEYIDKAQLISNTERNLKKAIVAGKEHSTKENLVKAKVRNARVERYEKKIQIEKNNNAAEAAIDQGTVNQDKSIESSKKAEEETAKTELKAAKEKLAAERQDLQTKKSKASALEKDVESTKAQLASNSGDTSLKSNLQNQEADLTTANNAVTAAEAIVSQQEETVGQKQGSVDALKSEVKQVAKAEGAAQAALDALNTQVKYKYVGNKPTAPTSEESELYRKFAAEVGLAIPGDGNNPIIPPATTAEGSQETETALAMEEEPATLREKMQGLDAQQEAKSEASQASAMP